MKTKSEQLFETFLTVNNVKFEKIEEIRKKGEYRPRLLGYGRRSTPRVRTQGTRRG
jgi:hypothetical protein